MSDIHIDTKRIIKQVEKLIPEMAERLGQELSNNIKRLSEDQMDPKVYIDDNVVKVVVYGDVDKIEKKLHPFEYTVNSLGKIIDRLGW